MSIDVGTEQALNQAIETVDNAASGTYVIQFTATIMEGTDTGDGWPADLGALNLQNGVSVTIDGGSYALDGAGLYRGLFVYAGDVTVQNLTIQNAVATGGAGANIAGGGAGLGGGLFIASGGTVTLDDVNITDNAEGGSGGGDPTAPLEPVGGGGGGLGGAGYLGAGGGVGVGATGSGASGIVFGAGPGAGGYSPFGLLSDGGPNGGSGGAGEQTSGAGGVDAQGITGGFGGGGGEHNYSADLTGGPGGFGGGGGGGGNKLFGDVIGGAGGFGGGGGGGGMGGALGGFGAGAGGSTGGGGGLAAGGDIFVQQGGTLVIEGGTLGAGTLTGGQSNGNGGTGAAYGSGIFLQGTQTQTFAPASGQTLTITGVIADQDGSNPHDPSGSTGAGGIIIGSVGGDTGTVDLAATNTFTNGITLESGVLVLGAIGAAGTGTITFGAGDPPSLAFTIADAPTNTIAGFDHGDTIDVTDLTTTATTATVGTGGLLAIPYTGGGTLDLTFDASYAGDVFTLSSDGATGTDISWPCFLTGTRIATERGDIAVEHLLVGDRVRVAAGGSRPVRWIGRRGLDPGRHARPRSVLPVRIQRDAFGPDLPRRDLFLSPDHAIFVEDVLIPAQYLVNGTTVRQMPASGVITYFHVELDRHDVLLAEGLTVESYLDTGNRAVFENGTMPTVLHPNFASRIWDAEGCAPLVVTGPRLEAAQRRLATDESVRSRSRSAAARGPW